MDPTQIYSTKAQKYARYRWSYASEAIQTIYALTGIQDESCVADIGAGTGILTREFIGKVRLVYAVEPNPEMRAIAEAELAAYPSCRVIAGRAEATTLSDDEVDLITAAQAMHWFEPLATKREFCRILKPGGWLAMCRNRSTDQELGEALEAIYPAALDTESLMLGKSQPRSFYFREGDYIQLEFPFETRVGWDKFFGALLTASYAPDEESEGYAAFERGAREVFERFSVDQILEQHAVTQLYLGRIAS